MIYRDTPASRARTHAADIRRRAQARGAVCPCGEPKAPRAMIGPACWREMPKDLLSDWAHAVTDEQRQRTSEKLLAFARSRKEAKK